MQITDAKPVLMKLQYNVTICTEIQRSQNCEIHCLSQSTSWEPNLSSSALIQSKWGFSSAKSQGCNGQEHPIPTNHSLFAQIKAVRLSVYVCVVTGGKSFSHMYNKSKCWKWKWKCKSVPYPVLSGLTRNHWTLPAHTVVYWPHHAGFLGNGFLKGNLTTAWGHAGRGR